MSAISPFLVVTRMVMTPFPPLRCSEYSENCVLLAYPSSVTVRTLPSTAAVIPTTASFRRVIPLTPRAFLPMGLTSLSWNLMAFPFLVAIKSCWSPSVLITSTSSSSPSEMAMIPLGRGFPYSLRAVFFTYPFRVTMTRYSSSGNESTDTTAVMHSSCSFSRLTMGFPLAVREAAGTS